MALVAVCVFIAFFYDVIKSIAKSFESIAESLKKIESLKSIPESLNKEE